MSTVKEIEAALPRMTTDDLLRIEQVLHQLYRQRGAEALVYDDAHGVFTEADLITEADVAFQAYDKAEDNDAKNPPR